MHSSPPLTSAAKIRYTPNRKVGIQMAIVILLSCLGFRFTYQARKGKKEETSGNLVGKLS